MAFDRHHELQMLEALADEPEISQADLAVQAGVAVGTVNWYLKRWANKGFIIVKRMGRWRWRYLVTPAGMAEKAQLTAAFLETSLRIYRETRIEARQLLTQVQRAGHDRVIIVGDGDVADICRLTCLEVGLVALAADSGAGALPQLTVSGRTLALEWSNKTLEPEA